jgi:RNA polymerase sigma-70 factor (ECF subfamily)
MTPVRPLDEIMADRETYLAFVRRRVRSGADAEDLFQQALVRATEHVDALREPSRTRAWFFQILRRVIADHHAAWALRESKLAVLAADMSEASPEEVAACACSLGQLERIRPDYADIVRRIDLDEEPLAKVASVLGITTNNATVRLHRARHALRDQLEAFCGTSATGACADCGCDS